MSPSLILTMYQLKDPLQDTYRTMENQKPFQRTRHLAICLGTLSRPQSDSPTNEIQWRYLLRTQDNTLHKRNHSTRDIIAPWKDNSLMKVDRKLGTMQRPYGCSCLPKSHRYLQTIHQELLTSCSPPSQTYQKGSSLGVWSRPNISYGRPQASTPIISSIATN